MTTDSLHGDTLNTLTSDFGKSIRSQGFQINGIRIFMKSVRSISNNQDSFLLVETRVFMKNLTDQLSGSLARISYHVNFRF